MTKRTISFNGQFCRAIFVSRKYRPIFMARKTQNVGVGHWGRIYAYDVAHKNFINWL